MPTDFQLKTMNAVHRALLKVSGGRIGWSAADMPVLELTTIGRKSGAERSVMLTTPLQDGDDIMIVASRGGDDSHPDWFVNLRANPEVQVKLEDTDKQPYRASIASGAERERMWTALTAEHDNYAGYQRKTDREIPVVVLTPAG
jgi:deazaflavin-dependent oxidoreductase (nitroreductase family)